VNNALRQAIAALVAVGGLAACGAPSAPDDDCSFLVGSHFIALEPEPEGYGTSYTIAPRDSIRLVASVRRIDAGARTFNPQQGFYCTIGTSSPLSAVVAFSTTDVDHVRLGTNGWIHAVSSGDATVKATSVSPAATLDIHVFVYR
jgi:hypothetical protein